VQQTDSERYGDCYLNAVAASEAVLLPAQLLAHQTIHGREETLQTTQLFTTKLKSCSLSQFLKTPNQSGNNH
jgi:hypothetical protein